MGKTALIIVDTQVNMFEDAFCVHNADAVLRRIRKLAQAARGSGTHVIYVRNNGDKGEPDEPNTPGWEIHPDVFPKLGEVVIDKHGPDAFEETNLQSELEARAIDHLVIAGMQTEICIDATSRRAHDLGYKVTVVENAHTTFDFEDLTTVEAISRVNKELRSIVNVLPVDQIKFTGGSSSA